MLAASFCKGTSINSEICGSLSENTFRKTIPRKLINAAIVKFSPDRTTTPTESLKGAIQIYSKCIQIQYCTFAFNSRSKHFHTTGLYSWLNIESCREVWHILATIADCQSVGARVQRDVGDGVSSISIILDMDLCLGAIIRDDLYGQLSRASIGAVNYKLASLTNFGSFQTWSRATDLRTDTGRDLVTTINNY